MKNDLLSEKDTQLVVDILVGQLGVEPDQVTLNASIQEELGADSLDVMEIIMAIEERFDVTVPDAVSERVKTVGDLMEVLAEMQSRN